MSWRPLSLVAILLGFALVFFLGQRMASEDEAIEAPPAAGMAAVRGLKGGQDMFGAYEAVPNWPKPLSALPDHEGWAWSTGMDIFAESPNRVFFLQKGEFARSQVMSWLPDGTFFVADGYINTRVVKFDKGGKFVKTWGEKGKGVPWDPMNPSPGASVYWASMSVKRHAWSDIKARTEPGTRTRIEAEGRRLSDGLRGLPDAEMHAHHSASREPGPPDPGIADHRNGRR